MVYVQCITISVFKAMIFFLMLSRKTPWNHPLSYQHGVSDKEDGGVVAHNIPVSFFCVHFHGETPGVTGCVSRSTLSTLSSKSENYYIIKNYCYPLLKSHHSNKWEKQTVEISWEIRFIWWINSPTVENLTARGVFLPTNSKGLAFVYFVMSWVHSKYPNAPKYRKYNLIWLPLCL